MIGLEQWRAAIGGWNSGNLSAIYRRYGSRRIVHHNIWLKHLLPILDNYSAVICYSVYWLIIALFTLMSEDGLFVALSLHADNFSALSTSAAMIPASRDSLQCLWVSTKPFVIQLRHLMTLGSPSNTAPTLRLLLALNWLLIVAGDVELNPGPLPSGKVCNECVVRSARLIS